FLAGLLEIIGEPHRGLREEPRERRAVGLLRAQLLQLLRQRGRALPNTRPDLLGQGLGLIQDLLAKLALAAARDVGQLRRVPLEAARGPPSLWRGALVH